MCVPACVCVSERGGGVECMSLLNMLQGSLGRIVDCQRGALLLDVIIGPQIVAVVLLVIVDQFPGKHGLHLKLK